MNGVIFNNDKEVNYCLIADFSEELETLLKSKLISICEGQYHSEKFKKILSYRNTLKIFLDRYDGKDETAQVGMVGELLCHILFPHIFPDLVCMSPYFNLEDGSIKKGHDLLYCNKAGEDIWIIEVKSGHLGKVTSVNQKKYNLLNESNRDLNVKLTGSSTNLWRNALKGMDTVLKDGVTKDTITELLSQYHDKTLNELQEKIDYNVILASALFHDTKAPVNFLELVNWKQNFKHNDSYKSCSIFAIQKQTYTKVIDFLRNESASEEDVA